MTPFRNWIHNLWIDNCEEHNVFAKKNTPKRNISKSINGGCEENTNFKNKGILND